MAAKAYWLAQSLGKHGHSVHVVTDRTDIAETHAIKDAATIPSHPGVTIHRPDHETPWHIPNEPHRAMSLLDKVLEVAGRLKADLIMAGYLVPYGMAAYLANRITGIPFVLYHGGSDVKKFVEAGVWDQLWPKVLSAAAEVLTDLDHLTVIKQWVSRATVLPPYVPDPEVFSPPEKECSNKPKLLALIGKANYYWQHKGWHRVIDICSRMKGRFEFVVVSQGIGFKDFVKQLKSKLAERATCRPFVPPWEMPTLLRSVDGVFHLEADLPFPIFSNLVVEALYCGTPIITDQDNILERYNAHGIKLSQRKEQVLSLPEQDPAACAQRISSFFDIHTRPRVQCDSGEFGKYLETYEELVAKCSGP